MKHPMIRSRRVRYGGMTVSLTVTLIAALVLLNVIFSTLARRYAWYIDMTPDRLYSVSDVCHDMISDVLGRAEDESDEPVKVEIIFAEDFTKYEPGSSGSYIYNTARELSDRHEQIELSWFDCWVEKSKAEELGVKGAQNVVLRASNGQSRVFRHQELFVFEPGNTTSPIGYDGERVFATSLVSLLGGDRPLACFTVNHDEQFYDETFLYTVRDAGYDVTLIDLYYDDIPADCELLVTYNPSTDFIVADGVSEWSELDKLKEYLTDGGNYMVCLSANTPELANFDQFLAEWGVSVGRDYDELTERSYAYMVKDASTALTSDGFTFLAEYASEGHGAAITADMTSSDFVSSVVFRDAAVLTVPDTYTETAAATYQSGTRVRSDVFYASKDAAAFASGKQITSLTGAFALMSVTKDSATDARVTVISSTEFGSQPYLQSAVFGNADALLCALREMGKEDVLIGLRYKPFAASVISSITSAQKLHWTLCLTLVPVALVAGTATVILVRRKYS